MEADEELPTIPFATDENEDEEEMDGEEEDLPFSKAEVDSSSEDEETEAFCSYCARTLPTTFHLTKHLEICEIKKQIK